MFVLIPANQFKKDVKALKKRSSKNEALITDFLTELAKDGASGIKKKHRAHKLSGDCKDNWEAHVKPDLLIIWFEITESKKLFC